MISVSLLKKIIYLITTISFFAFSQVVNAQKDTLSCTKPVITGANNWYPYAYVDEKNTPKGIGYDVVKLVFSDLKTPLQYKVGLPWIRTIREVNQGEIDILVANYWTVQRAKQLLMSREIARESLNVFTLQSRTFEFNKWDDLKDKYGVMPRGMAVGKSFEQYRKKISLIEVNTHKQIFKMLNKGRADYVLMAQNSARPYLEKNENKNVIMLDTPINHYSVRISFSKKSSCQKLFNQFDHALTKRINDGSVAKIISTYTQQSILAK